MSENLKRAESLFNRIMNQNKPASDNGTYKTHYKGGNHTNHTNHGNSGNHGSNGSNSNNGNHSHSNGSGHRYNSRSYKHNMHHHNNSNNNNGDAGGHSHAAPHPVVDLPKRDPVKEARDAVDKVLQMNNNQHILLYCWTIWYHSRNKSNKNLAEEAFSEDPEAKDSARLAAVDSYLQAASELEFPCFGNAAISTKPIASIEQMWMSMSTLKKLHDLVNGSELLIFKTGVNPVWEDPINAKGGRWIFRFNHRLNPASSHQDSLDLVLRGRRRATLVWERLVLKTLSGSLLLCRKDHQDALLSDIVGLVLSIRRDDVIISLWNSNLNFFRKKYDDDDKKGLNAFHARRVYCDAILRVIREADSIILGSDCIDTYLSLSNERVNGVAFEYRLHSDNSHSYDRSKRKY